MKKVISLLLVSVMIITLTGCNQSPEPSYPEDNKLVVYNWGEYLDPDALLQFETETGIDVSYNEFETNEMLYPIIANQEGNYDVICPSDYMIERMIGEDLLEEINFDNIPNIKYIDKEYMDKSKGFDPENKYSVPFFFGTVGILYDTTKVTGPVDSWGILWDTTYQDDILMQRSVRDIMGIALKYLGYSFNTTKEEELNAARDKLIEQKKSGVVQAYVVDEVRDKMIAGEAAIGVIYSGEALTCQEENENLEYVVPKEGSNFWIDSWAIPKGSKHKENAEKFIDFLCRPEIAAQNFEYVTYSIPNSAGRDLIEEEEYRNNETVFPGKDILDRCEVLNYLGNDMELNYLYKFREVRSVNE